MTPDELYEVVEQVAERRRKKWTSISILPPNPVTADGRQIVESKLRLLLPAKPSIELAFVRLVGMESRFERAHEHVFYRGHYLIDDGGLYWSAELSVGSA